MKIYEKTSMNKFYWERKHFYKNIRWIFFNKFIFTLDIYPEQINFGFMIAMTSKQWTVSL